MLIFIISFVLTAIISACFFKNRFWENRYLVLLIGAGVALVATLTTNFIVRGHLETKSETIWTKQLGTIYLPDTIMVDTAGCQRTTLVNYDWYSDYDADDFYADSTKPQIPVSFVLFSDDKKTVPEYWGTMTQKGIQRIYAYKTTFVECSKDSLAYIVKKKLVYNIPPSNWITGFSFPRIETAWVLYFPKQEYDMIPDSLIRKSPF